MAAKTKEVNALIKTIEEKIERSGALGVEIQEMKNDLGDTAECLNSQMYLKLKEFHYFLTSPSCVGKNNPMESQYFWCIVQ